MRKITFSILLVMMCFIGFSQTFTGGGTPIDTQNNNGNTDATCGTGDELNLTVDVTGIGVLGTTNILDQVDIDITHTWSGDVNVTLIAPDGTTSANLTSGNGGSGDDYTGTQFRDDAATAITAGTAPFTGAFQPEEALGTFNGVDADGTWTLNFCDSANGDTGTFNSWSITFAAAPSCNNPSGISDNPTSSTETTITWLAGGSETDWTYEWGATGFTPGAGTTGMAMTTPSTDLTGLMAGTTYDIYVTANCGGGDGDSGAVLYTWTQPAEGESCSLPLSATVETDCSMATPFMIDFSTAPNIGGTGSCDPSGDNRGYWYEFTAPASGSIIISNSGATNEIVILDACGGTEIVCGTLPDATDTTILGLTPNAVHYMAIWKDSFQTLTNDSFCIEAVSCIPPTLDTATINDAGCNPDGSGTFTIDIVVTDAGDGNSVFDDGTTTYPVVVGTVVLGPYMTGASIDVDLDNTADDNCDFALGNFTFTCPLPPPANDLCSGAIALTPGAVFTDNPITGQTNDGATDSGEMPLPGCATYDPTDASGRGGDVWYSVTVPSDGNLTIETDSDPTGAGGDGGMAVYTGTCGSLALFECSDDDGNGLYGQVIIEPADGLADETVYVRVWEFGGDAVINFQVSAFSATLDIEDADNQAAFTYYPNPVKNVLTLNAQNTIENVTIYNMLGQEVLRANPNSVDSDIDMSSLANGSYFVKVTIANVTKTIRVIKQ